MAHDVFISHSNKDKQVADALCAGLESERIRCWLAPRDVQPGSDWASEIVKAVEGSRVMVLIFSENSAESTHVRREITAAANAGVIIVPLKIDATDPTGAMQYYLADTHWLDAVNPPTTEQIAEVVRRVANLLDKEYDAASLVVPKPQRKVPVAAIVVATVVLILLVAGVGGYLALRSGRGPAKSTAAPDGGAAASVSGDASSTGSPPASAPDGKLDTVDYKKVVASLPKDSRSTALDIETISYDDDPSYRFFNFTGTWEGHKVEGCFTFDPKWRFLYVTPLQFDDMALEYTSDTTLNKALDNPDFRYFYEEICAHPSGAKITVGPGFDVGAERVRSGDKLTFDHDLRLVRTSW